MFIGLTYRFISNKWKYISIIITGNAIIILALVLTFLVSVVLENSIFGFILLLFCCFLIGVGSNLSQLTFMAMINYLSEEVVSKYTVGTAAAGLVMIAVRSFLTLIYGTEDAS